MRIHSTPFHAELAAGQVLTLDAARGLRVTCESGQLWVTEEAQPDDVWLAAGQRVRLAGDGRAVVEAKVAASVRID